MADREVTIVWGGCVSFGCRWAASQVIKGDETENTGNTASQVVDLYFTTKRKSFEHANLQGQTTDDDAIFILGDDGKPQSADEQTFGSEAAIQFLLSCLQAVKSTGSRVARLVIPLQEGVLVRSDILPLRLKDASAVDEVASFSAPLQRFPGTPLSLEDMASLPAVFRASAGGILLQRNGSGVSDAFEADFDNKLSTAWVTPGPEAARRRRVVVVGCGYRDPSSGGWMAYVFGAARAQGVDLVVVDRAGSWIERAEFADSYEALLAAGPWWANPPAADMGERVAELVAAYGRPVDGIVTFSEPFLASVSRAAARLGLPGQPAASYEVATDKYRLGRFEGRKAFCGATAEEALRFARDEALAYPLILKPRLGLNSEGVVRVDGPDAIRPAVDMIQKTFFKSFTLERYCDGPEVDVNVVLLDGEVLSCEIADDFPKPGDMAKKGPGSAAGADAAHNNFLETYIVYPSALPSPELAMLRDSISATIRRLGFSSGIMHVEARVDRSSVEYRPSATDGVVDLAPRQDNAVSSEPPASWVLEINPRPPGLTASRIIESVYGVDYFGVALALAVDDKDRVRALARPFRDGAQYTGVMALIRADYDEDRCEGIFDSDDICEELLARRPDLAQHINRYGCLAKRGQKIPHPSSGSNTFVAYFNVFSRSRKEALEVAAEVKREVRYSFR
ncbi:glutathione synthetase ATP-binding domain-like protein [Hypoxylon sp. FL1284]|nr:glutathione synthetase ATP-binding domain-like protein [Hypoxylon sp. FL1284]